MRWVRLGEREGWGWYGATVGGGGAAYKSFGVWKTATILGQGFSSLLAGPGGAVRALVPVVAHPLRACGCGPRVRWGAVALGRRDAA